MNLSLEDLFNIQVTTASRKKQRIFETAAAAYVVTSEDIRRSGATSLPEVLRMVPGLQVARIDSNKWSVGTRGFAGRFSNKLLVMIDGRSIYTHIYSGVLWSSQDVPLEDIDRIEVVRGSGASLWGVNAVNGIINIITMSARATEGNLIAVSGGFDEPSTLTVRSGKRISDELSFRAFVKGRRQDESLNQSLQPSGDDFDDARAGLRVDWEPTSEESLTIDGMISRNRSHDRMSMAIPTAPFLQINRMHRSNEEGDVRVRWEKELEDGSGFVVQSYLDKATTGAENFILGRVMTADFDAEYRLARRKGHELQWGGGYRLVEDSVAQSSFAFQLQPAHRSMHQLTTFVQDDIAISESVRLTAGSKFGFNSFSGFEIQPNVRALWAPAASHKVWGAVSRAVRTPSRSESDMRWIVGMGPASTFLPRSSPLSALMLAQTLYGSTSFQPEVLRSAEGGYRFSSGDRVQVQAAVFHNWYSGLRSKQQLPMRPVTRHGLTYLEVPVEFTNGQSGRSYGAEVDAEVRWSDSWRFSANYGEARTNFSSVSSPGTAALPAQTQIEGETPRHQVFVRSSHDVGRHVELDATWRWVSSLTGYKIPAYASANVGVTLKFENVELGFGGTDLLAPRHLEYGPNLLDGMPSPIYVKRGFYSRLALKF